MQEQEPSVRR